ncbi:hypothetical protein [[Actinomadura] parvosata]|nr:hypothetical protein [Nonomuraea sp. ATCC 55076]
MSGSFVVVGLRVVVAGLRVAVVGLLEGTVCFLAGNVGNASTPWASLFLGSCAVSAAFFVGWAAGGAGKVTYAAAESPDPIDPPSPSPLNALTEKPTLCPAALDGTASTALHEEPAHALSADNRPTTPDCVFDTSYDCRSGSAPLLQVTSTLSVPCLLAFTPPGASAGRRSLNVLLAYLVPVISPLRVTVKVPLGALPASNVPEIVWLAPPSAILWLGVEGPSTYSPIFSCMSPVRAETTTDEPEITSPSEGEVICPEEPACPTAVDA